MSAALMGGPVGIGLAAASFLPGLLGGKKKPPSIGSVNRKYMGQSPEGTLSAADSAFGESTRLRANQSVGAYAGRSRQAAARRMAARGIVGPAAEQAQADVNQATTEGIVGNARNASDLLYSLRNRNQDFERSKLMKAWGLEAGDAMQQQQLQQAQQSEFWNSQMQFLPQLLSLGQKSGGLSQVGAAGVVGSGRGG
jgi:hypothetical protein